MLTGISILISFIVVCLLIAIFPTKVEKKPLYIVTGISGLVVILSVFSAYVLVWWYGIMVFAGLLLSITILVGKKMEWLKPVNRSEEEILHKPFPLELKETGKGHSIFDEETQQVMGKDFIATRLRNQRIETLQKPVQAISAVSIDEKEWGQEDDLVRMSDGSNEGKDIDFILEFNPEPLIDSTERLNSKTSETGWEQLTENENTVEQDLTLSLEVEELSDEWLKNRLDALYGEEHAATFESEVSGDDDSFLNEPFVSNMEKNHDFALVQGQEYPSVDDVEFEDLSQLYYDRQRGENDGTAE